MCVQVMGKMDHLAASFFYQKQVLLSILQSLCLFASSLTRFAYDLFKNRPLLHRNFFSLTSCLHVFFSADVLTDRVIALEADAWTQDDIARYHELILKLGRISGIHPYTSHLITQGGVETCLWT